MDTATVIDGTNYGNESRFLNHSCSPNCHTVKWIVNGEERLGIFANEFIKAGTELTYDYQYEVPNCDDVSVMSSVYVVAGIADFFWDLISGELRNGRRC